MYNMAVSISVSKARSELPRILGLIQDGEEVTLTRHGQAVAVVVRPDTLRVRRTSEVDAVAQKLASSLNLAAGVPLDDVPLADSAGEAELLEELASNRSNRADR